ncbi:tyrosine-type recombinase/integrase [Cupriavidus gilardii]|nr:tyrosine-type recombinase/integrase [Cupriavidus gilardii]
MANRPQALTNPPLRTYTRTEFAALRAWMQGVPPAVLARQYLQRDADAAVDDDEISAADTERFLRTMRDELVRLAILHGSQVLADHLRASIGRHGSARLGPASLRMVEDAARLARAAPRAEHAVRLWLRPLVADRLTAAGIATLADLAQWINRRGPSWWRSLPRIGPGRARAIVAWLRQHESDLQLTVASDVSEAEPAELRAPVDELVEVTPAAIMASGASGATVPQRRLAPLERLAVPEALSGARGANRAAQFPYVRARHDLEAVRAYLAGFSGQDATQRAYRRELERLLLWAVAERGTALSSLTVEDCEAYKAFLAAPTDPFTGPAVSRASGRWRPFAPGGLSAASQRYAVRALRAAFDWLVDVRYLAGNPWRAVRDPVTVRRARPMRIERALPMALWRRVRQALKEQADGASRDAPRWRAARALLLLMGDAGLRIAEAAAARRESLQWLPEDAELPATWLLAVVGKGAKERFVPLSGECVAALAAHWADRGRDFNAPDATGALVAPLVLPPTPRARAKFSAGELSGEHDAMPSSKGETAGGKGYSVRGARALVDWAIGALPAALEHLTEPERRQLDATSPHAFRHTFGTQAVASEMPLDVVQRIMGHASLQTTSTYVTAEQRRIRAEAAKFFGRMSPQM